MEKKAPKRQNKKLDLNDIDFGKVPPQSMELEESVLGALMIEADSYPIVGEILTVESFYKPAHQKIYKAICDLAQKEQPIDLYTVTEKLLSNGELEDIGGAYYLGTLTAKVASAAHLEYHAKILAQKFVARELIRVSTEIQTKAFDEKYDVEELLQEAEGQIFEVSQRNMKKDVTQIDPVIREAMRRIQLAAAQTEGLSGVRSGFHALDKVTSGWQRSDLIIIAARPAMGKTAFVLSMAKNMAVDYNTPCAIFSLEMSNVQLVNRLIVNVCQITGDKIKNGQLEKHEWEQLDYKIKNLEGAPLYIDDTPSLSVLELRTKARRLVHEHGVKCIIIDYLQLMNAQGMSFYSREQEVSIISRSLKGLAKELDIPIIALSQLNRSVESRAGQGVDGKKPQLSDLRESGAIEQDADMVCFIHRPDYYKIYTDPNTNKDLRGLAQIIIAKHRNGSTEDVDLRFRSEYAQFLNEEEDVSGYQSFSSRVNNEVTPSAAPKPSYTLPDSGDDGMPTKSSVPF